MKRLATNALLLALLVGLALVGQQLNNPPAAIGGNAATATALAANGTNCSAGSFPLGVDASGNAESCTVESTSAIAAMATLHASDAAAFCTGTQYTLTTTPAAVDCATTDPGLTIAAAGTWLILGSMCYDHVGATYSANRNLVGSINRTNNTPGALTNSGLTIQTGIVTTVTVTAGCSATQLIYTTSNSNDALALFASESVAPDAGSTVVARARLAAIRLY